MEINTKIINTRKYWIEFVSQTIWEKSCENKVLCATAVRDDMAEKIVNKAFMKKINSFVQDITESVPGISQLK